PFAESADASEKTGTREANCRCLWRCDVSAQTCARLRCRREGHHLQLCHRLYYPFLRFLSAPPNARLGQSRMGATFREQLVAGPLFLARLWLTKSRTDRCRRPHRLENAGIRLRRFALAECPAPAA